MATTATTDALYRCDVAGMSQFKAVISSRTTGTVTVTSTLAQVAFRGAPEGSGGGGSGTVTSVATGTCLTGGPITTTGTLSVTANCLGPTQIDATANYTWSGISRFTGVTSVPHSTTPPGTCTVGEVYMDTDATSSLRWLLCESTNTWVAQGSAALTLGHLTDTGTDGITVTGGTGAVVGTGTSFAQHAADSTHNGYLASTDWATFTAKQAAGAYLTGNQTITLSGDVTGTGATAITTVLANIPTAAPMVGSLLATAIVAPGTPASGKDALYVDSTDLRFHDRNASGVIGTTVVADTGASNHFVTAISAAGAITKAQPSCASLSDSGTGCAATAVLPALVGTTGSIGGGLLSVACTSGTAAVPGVTTAMALAVTPVAYPGDGVYWHGYYETTDTVTVKVCTVAAITPVATPYNVRAVQ
jgi:hypothetical protein